MVAYTVSDLLPKFGLGTVMAHGTEIAQFDLETKLIRRSTNSPLEKQAGVGI